jgi:hypothetical protein
MNSSSVSSMSRRRLKIDGRPQRLKLDMVFSFVH